MIVRIRTKWSLIFRLIGKLCGSLFFLEIIRIITYVAFQYMESGSCQVGQVAEVIRMAALSYLTFLALFLIQMLLELRFNSKCALISSFSVYLLLVGVGSLLYTESHYSILNIVNLPNYLMYTRYLSLVKEYHLSYSGIMISIGSICVVLLLLMKCCLKKKDMI